MFKSSYRDSFRKLRNNQNVQVLVSNFLWLSILRLVGFVFPLITLPYLSRVIGVDKFGIIAFAASVIYFLEIFVDFGFNYTATRDIAKNRDNRQLVERIFSDVFWSKSLLMLVGFIILLFVILISKECRENSLLLFITFLYIPGHILFPDWFFQAMEDMKYITILNVLSKCFFTVMVFILIQDQSDYILQPLLTALGYWISGIIAMLFIKKKYKVKIGMPKFKNTLIMIKSGMSMFLCQFIPSLYSNFSVIALQSFSGSESAGLFSSGKRIPDVMSQVAALLSRVFFPYLSRNVNRHSLYVYINLAISILFAIPLFFMADIIIDIFFTEEFREAAKVIRIFAISIPFQFIDISYGNNYLVVVGKESLLMKNIFVGSFLGVVMSIIFIKNYSYIGAAYTFLFMRVYFAMSNYYLYRLLKRNVRV